MADIRQNATIKDDFNRANESPLSWNGAWAQTDSGVWTPLVGKSNMATHSTSGGSSSNSYWTAESFDGDSAECWAWTFGGGASGIAWRVCLFLNVGGSNAVDGYRFGSEHAATGDGCNIHKVTNGSVSTIASGPNPGDNGGYYMLIRRNGNAVEGWTSTDGTTWTFRCSANDTTYTTGLYLALGINDNSNSQILAFDYFGGGGKVRRPQIYRYVSN